MDVAVWLRQIGLGVYVPAFEANDVDAATLRALTEGDLDALGVTSVGHRRKLLQAIAALDAGEPASASVRPATPTRPDAELRQLTVLYCDMVGSTALSEQLHPEDMRLVVRSFHAACTPIVLAHDGWFANFLGDGVLAYFGWPRAHEDDAERAVRAGLLLVQAIEKLRAPEGHALAARVGIATGTVVVGDLIHEGPAQEQSAVGLAPNLGARLLNVAAPGQVAIDEPTRRLLASDFVLQALGRHALKGIAEPVAVYAVADERQHASRFDARERTDLAPMVGRERELALLLERWQRAVEGEGQAVLLLGDAGIGKSRLARALLDACAAQPHARLRLQCSSYHGGNALWPVTQWLARRAGLTAHDALDAALDKIEALTGRGGTVAALYATLLGLDGTQRYGPLEMSAPVLRERTLETLVEQLFRMAGPLPLLLVLEDAHWIDPTTLELIERCLRRIGPARVLVLVTSRTENPPAFAANPDVARLSLSRLGHAGVEAILARLGGEGFQAHTRARIVMKSDGVPLFVEELTKAVLETGEAAVPASLQGSLMARLDRIPEAKQVAQIAACIGREFDLELLAAVTDSQRQALTGTVESLLRAEVVVRRSGDRHANFMFRHALLQEAAYESLLRSRQRQVHGRILEALAAASRRRVPPELLAHHATRAGRTEKAVEQWGLAGMAALSKSAYAEAARYLEYAIDLIHADAASGVDWRARELELQVKLGQARMAIFGYGAEGTRLSFERARALLDITQDTTLRVPVLYGLWSGNIMADGTEQALRMGHDLLAAGKADDDPQTMLVAHRLVGSAHLERGEWTPARSELERALQVYDRDASRYRGLSAIYGMDPGASACGNLAVASHVAGFPDQAMALAARVRAMASEVKQAIARAPMYCECANLAVLRGDLAWIERDGDVFASLASENGLGVWRAYSVGIQAWKLLSSGRPEDAIDGFRRCLAELERCGARVRIQQVHLGLARALADGGQLAEASRVLDDGLRESARAGRCWLDAELWRARGEVAGRTASTPDDHAEVVRCFERALQIARAQGALAWELRAATSLARHAGQRDRGDRARMRLLSVYRCFREGFETPDLGEARALLDELGTTSTDSVVHRGRPGDPAPRQRARADRR